MSSLLIAVLFLPGTAFPKMDPAALQRCRDAMSRAINDADIQKVKTLEQGGCDLKTAAAPNGIETNLISFLYISKITGAHHAMLKYLISRGIKINARIYVPQYMNTYLLVLSCSDDQVNKQMTRLLLENGADPRVREPEKGTTALHHAVLKRDLATVRLLVEKGADVNARDKDGMTPLINLGMDGGSNPAIARYLIEKGAKIDAFSNDGFSALILAASIRHNELAQALIDKGANVNLKNKKGNTALDWAVAHGHEDTVELLKKYGARKGRPVKSGPK